MDRKSVSDVLRSLATGEKNRSESARLRDVFDSVEAAIAAGVSRTAILEALHGEGFTMTLKTFDNALYRIRKRNQKATKTEQKIARPPPKPIGEFTPTPTKPEPPVTASHDPKALTEIMSAPVDLDALSKHSKRNKK